MCYNTAAFLHGTLSDTLVAPAVSVMWDKWVWKGCGLGLCDLYAVLPLLGIPE